MEEPNLEQGFEPYLSRGKVNDEEITILRDTDSMTDVIPGKIVKVNQLNGQVSWVKQPLAQDLPCLPIAEVNVELADKTVITTKAIVADQKSDVNCYILGNITHKLIEEIHGGKPQTLHAVTTRAQVQKRNENRSEILTHTQQENETLRETKQGMEI